MFLELFGVLLEGQKHFSNQGFKKWQKDEVECNCDYNLK